MRSFLTSGRTALASLLAGGALVAAIAFTSGVPTTASAQGEAAKVTYTVDTSHSSVAFRIMWMGTAPFWGRFDVVSGTLTGEEGKPESLAVNIEVKADSVNTGNDKREQHLTSPDFFNAKQFPSITFKSTSVKAIDADSFEMTGDLTLNGTTKTITFPFEKTGEGKGRSGKAIVGAEATMTIKRSDFGMTYGVEAGALSDEVRIIVALAAERQ